MSGISGILNLNFKPVNCEDLDSLASSGSYRGPDSYNRWASGPVGLSHYLFKTTITEDSQPLDIEGDVITLDGRVDNRSVLLKSLGLGKVSDERLVLTAFKKWGKKCFTKIVGDFSLAIWDNKNQELILARDSLGMRPLYFYHDPEQVVFASEAHQLVSFLNLTSFNLTMAAQFLSCRFDNPEQSFYKGVNRVLPAQYVSVKGKTIESATYWKPNPKHRIRLSSDTEYAEAFLEILKETVESRLEGVGEIGAELSGGLDSTSVIGIAKKFFPEQSKKLQTFSLTFPGRKCDERSYISEAKESYRLERCHFINPSLGTNAHYQGQARFFLDPPELPNATCTDQVKKSARLNGCKILLTGFGGDELFPCESDFWFKDSRLYLYARELGRFLFPSLRSRAARKDHPPWLHPSLLRRSKWNPLAPTKNNIPALMTSSQAYLWDSFYSGLAQYTFEREERSSSWHGIEQRHPFRDRRLFEFCFALPEEQLLQDGVTKYVLRNAMSGILPEKIRTRKTKADISFLIPESLKSLNEDFSDSTLFKKCWLKKKYVQQMYRELKDLAEKDSELIGTKSWPLWNFYSVATWVNETRKSQKPHSTNQEKLSHKKLSDSKGP